MDAALLSKNPVFSCGDEDLDDFFLNNSENYNRQLLGKSFCYCLKEKPETIVCAFTLSNSSVDVKNLPNSRRKKLTEYIPFEKRMKNYPSVLIGRLGVNEKFKGKGIGTELIANVIKPWFSNFQIGCRYITVDAYNNEPTRKFYENNGFSYIFSTEQQEKEYIGIPENNTLKTRLMYFDLILLSNK
ncbi:N-acetyltransferase [Bacteroidia bacterium]|nr:N-acetyltransferase [Bacteroidia bacterium]